MTFVSDKWVYFLKGSSNPRQLLKTYKNQLSLYYCFYTKASSIVLPGPFQLNACENWKHLPAPWWQGEFNQKTNCFHFSITKTPNCCGDYRVKTSLPGRSPFVNWLSYMHLKSATFTDCAMCAPSGWTVLPTHCLCGPESFSNNSEGVFQRSDVAGHAGQVLMPLPWHIRLYHMCY